MRPAHAGVLALLLPVLAACAHQVDRGGTLASLHQVRPDTKEVPVDQGLDRAVQSYRDFLQQAPESNLAPEAMRRLADLNIEKEYGIHGTASPSSWPPPKAPRNRQPLRHRRAPHKPKRRGAPRQRRQPGYVRRR